MASPSSLQAWAVEADSIQITWGQLPAGQIRARAASNQWLQDHPGGPGGIELDGLRPDTTYEIRLVVQGQHSPIASHTIKATTLKPPPGQELARIATISDLHVGTSHFGFLKTMTEDGSAEEVYSVRCARSAIAAAKQWGADLLIIKGDAAHHRRHSDYELLGNLVDEFKDLEMVLLPGNHDVDKASEMELPEFLGDRKLRFETEAKALDLPGLRLVTTDTTLPGRGSGSILRTQDAVLDLCSGAQPSGGVMMASHHQFQQRPIPTYWPPGISASEGKPFLDRLERIAPSALVTSGHTHRCRAYKRNSILLTEVSSTSDFPGSWAGYTVYEGGITQSVRRITSQSEMEWLEYSKGALLGLWGKWSPGLLGQRCLTHSWAGKS